MINRFTMQIHVLTLTHFITKKGLPMDGKKIYIIQDGLVKYLSHYVRVFVTSTILLLAFNCGLSLYFIYLS